MDQTSPLAEGIPSGREGPVGRDQPAMRPARTTRSGGSGGEGNDLSAMFCGGGVCAFFVKA